MQELDFTDDELDRLLQAGEQAPLLKDYFGEDQYTDLVNLAQGSAKLRSRRKGTVFLLPGIMGSKLSSRSTGDTDLIWFNPRALRNGRVRELEWQSDVFDVIPTGVFRFAYELARQRLLWRGYSVSFMPYDWRKSIAQIAEELLPRIEAAEKPVSLVCHSMGGLVGRSLAGMAGPEEIDKVITLATPNRGSYSPVTVFRGIHRYVQLLGRLDDDHTARQIVENFIREYPGLIEMMPSPEARPDEPFFDVAGWPNDSWIPTAKALDEARTAQAGLPPPDERFHQVIALGEETIQAAELNPGGFKFERSNDGDGTVPRDLAEMDGVAARYYIASSHGSICNKRAIARACDAILQGKVPDLKAGFDQVRSATARVAIAEKDLKREVAKGLPRGGDPEKYNYDPRLMLEGLLGSEVELDAEEVEAGGPAGPDGPDDPSDAGPTDAPEPGKGEEPRNTYVYSRPSTALRRINVDFLNQSILDVPADAYVLAVFEGNQALGGAAGAVDKALGGVLSTMIADGQVSGRRGEIVFIPVPRYQLKTSHVIVVGLGVIGDPKEIPSAVNVAGRNLMRQLCISNVSSLASILIGAGSGANATATLQALFSGFFDALADWDEDQGFNRIKLCELSERRFGSLVGALNKTFAGFNMPDCEIVIRSDPVRELAAPELAKRGLAVQPKATMPHIFSARAELVDEDLEDPSVRLEVHYVPGRSGGTAAIDPSEMNFKMSELDAVMEPLSEKLGNDEIAPLAKSVEELVLSKNFRNRFNERAADGRGLQVICDAWASKIPWEVMHLEDKPLALNGGISRWFLAANSGVRRSGRRSLAHDLAEERPLNMLLVADPTEDLPGARREFRRIRDTLKELERFDFERLYQDEATVKAVTDKLKGTGLGSRYDVLHYAGHAFFDPVMRHKSGLKLAGGNDLIGSKIAALPHVPGFVFLNACESVRVRRDDGDDEEHTMAAYTDRNVGLAEAFLMAGVRHIVGTFWPVPDKVALNFAGEFYKRLPNQTVGDALLEARKEIADEMGRADWVNYIHYGAANIRL